MSTRPAAEENTAIVVQNSALESYGKVSPVLTRPKTLLTNVQPVLINVIIGPIAITSIL